MSDNLEIPFGVHISDMLFPAKIVTLTLPVAVPVWTRWLACDPSGSVCAFAEKPVAGDHCWESPTDRHRKLMVAEATYWWVDKGSSPDTYADWRDMLWSVE